MTQIKFNINAVLVVSLFAILIGCNKKEDLPTKEMISYAIEYEIESIDEYLDKGFEVCGHLDGSWDDSVIINSMLYERLDTIFSENDFDYMLEQYNEFKGQNIDEYLTDFNLNFEYSNDQSKHLDVHYCLSPPLYSLSKDSWVIFVEVFTKNGFDRFFMHNEIKPEEKMIYSTLHSNSQMVLDYSVGHKHAFWLNFMKND